MSALNQQPSPDNPEDEGLAQLNVPSSARNARFVEVTDRIGLPGKVLARELHISTNYISMVRSGRRTPSRRLLRDLEELAASHEARPGEPSRKFDKDWLELGARVRSMPQDTRSCLCDMIDRLVEFFEKKEAPSSKPAE